MAWCGSAWVLLSFSPDILSSHWVSGLPDLTNNGTVEKKMARVAKRSRRHPLLPDMAKGLSKGPLPDMLLALRFLLLLKYCILSQTRISRFLEMGFTTWCTACYSSGERSPPTTTWVTLDTHFDHSLFHAPLFFFHFPSWHDPEMQEHMDDWTLRISLASVMGSWIWRVVRQIV